MLPAASVYSTGILAGSHCNLGGNPAKIPGIPVRFPPESGILRGKNLGEIVLKILQDSCREEKFLAAKLSARSCQQPQKIHGAAGFLTRIMSSENSFLSEILH